MRKQQDFTFIQGDWEPLEFYYTNEGSVASLTNHQIWITLKPNKALSDTDEGVIQKTIGNGITIISTEINNIFVANGLAQIDFDEAETRAMSEGASYQYDLQIRTPEGRIKTLYYGTIKAVTDITISST